MGATANQYPSAAFGLTIAAAVLIILSGLVIAAVGAFLTFFLFGVGAVFGLVGVLWGVLLIVCAVRLRSNPQQHTMLGVAIVLLSIFSFFGAAGGFGLGFLLGLIGGIMALVWNPGVSMSVNVTASSAANIPVSASSGSTRFCPNCGAPVEAGAKFCRSCGKVL